jgi:hypothetical protein
VGFLYINSHGKQWKQHSYSAGNDWDGCPYRYYLRRVLGWKEKNIRARFELGKAFEDSIEFYHDNQGDLAGAMAHFTEKWTPFRDVQELQYTRVEKDWATCHRIGVDWLKLYNIRQPHLPIPLGGAVKFQQKYAKEVFPNDPIYGEIQDTGKLDMVAWVDPQHPMLPKLDWKPEYGAFRPLVIDIKTSGADFPETYGLAAYDTQLRRYSWLSGIRDVAFLWFVKKSSTLQKGYSVTLLENAGYMKAGEEAVIACMVEEGIWLLPNDFMVDEMSRIMDVAKKNASKGEKTAASEAARDEWLGENGVFTSEDVITKQRLQFNAGFVTLDSANDAGAIARKQIIEIVNARISKIYPNTWSVRYPKNDLNDLYFRAFALKDQMVLKQHFVKSDEDIDLFEEADDEQAD